MANFLNTDGLSALWAKIKSKFYTKTEVDALIPENEIMVVNISWDDANQKYVADKTAQEIVEFVNDGGVAVVNSDDSNQMILCNTALFDVTENYYYAGFYYAAIEDVEGGTLAYGGSVNIKHENGIESVDIAQGNNSIPLPAGNSDGVPIMDGTASRGDSINYARADHVHPSDTNKANVADVLTKTNTTSYTPTGDYNPATKKYVDDTIPTKTSDLTNDSLFLSGSAQSSSYANGYILIGTKNNSSATLADTLQVSSTTTGNNPSQTLTVGRSHSNDGFKGEIQLSNRPSIGGYTTITPTANSAITLSLPSASGTLALTTDISTTLSGLTDTNIASPENGQVLKYDSTSSKWVNGDVGGVFETALSYNESTDVISSNRTYAEIVAAYNSGKTCIATMDGIVFGLSQVVAVDNDQDLAPFIMFTGLLEGAGHIIIKIYNTGEIEDSQEGNFLENLDNVQPGILQNGQVLQYDATNEVWVNATLPTGITETRVNELIAAALAQYGDGDTASYGYTDASEVNY